jgi:hypothetical protein
LTERRQAINAVTEIAGRGEFISGPPEQMELNCGGESKSSG